jgi:regulatory protein
MSDASQSIHDMNSDLFEAVIDERFESAIEARKKAMDYLARREYGREELRKKLLQAGYTDNATDEAVGQLTSDGLQDDARFIESFIRSRVSQGKGPVRIRSELGQRGLDSGLIEQGLDEAGEDWYLLTKAVRQQKFGDEIPKDFKQKARQMRFLQYRGFEQSHIQASVSACNY